MFKQHALEEADLLAFDVDLEALMIRSSPGSIVPAGRPYRKWRKQRSGRLHLKSAGQD
jgi:hypothetical protein